MPNRLETLLCIPSDKTIFHPQKEHSHLFTYINLIKVKDREMAIPTLYHVWCAEIHSEFMQIV